MRILRLNAIYYWFVVVIGLGSLAIHPAHTDNHGTFIDQVCHHIEKTIDGKEQNQKFICRGETICGLELLPIFYNARHYAPVWIDTKGVRPPAKALLQTLAHIDTDGLNPNDYHFASLQAMLADVEAQADAKAPKQPHQWAELDVLFTDAFLLLASHLSSGRVNPETLHTDWILSKQHLDLMELLNAVITESHLMRIVDDLRPAHSGYLQLKEALEKYKNMEKQGGWPQVPDGPTLRPGQHGARILTLRHRLHKTQDLLKNETVAPPDQMDDDLIEAVRRFQQRHGLKVDGLVGKKTLAQLNLPMQERIRQIQLNLERWRWLPDKLGDPYIMVNTAEFNLKIVQEQSTVLAMRVVVGQPARRTPVFSAQLRYLVINPYWTVPPTIAVEDVLPRVLADPDYLNRNQIKVYYGWDENATPLNPETVDWNNYGRDKFPFRMVQAPGPANALGRIKFMFPNKFDIYLHDTPHRALFGAVERDQSSGCIRVEKPVELASYLLKDTPGWSREKIEHIIAENQRQVVHLKTPIPLHLLYMTAWVDEQGIIQFRKDIYGRDAKLSKALEERLPKIEPTLQITVPYVQ